MGGQIEEKKQALWRLLRVAWATFWPVLRKTAKIWPRAATTLRIPREFPANIK
jgi:hypothetical protein